MKKLLLTLLAVLLLLASCTIDGTNPGAGPNEDPDTPVVNPSVKINLINRGDFEVFAVNSVVDGFSWGSSNATVVLDDTNNKVAKLIATETNSAYMYHRNTQSFSGSPGVLSAKIKLKNTSDASKVRLKFEMENTAGTVVEWGDVKPEENTGWQTVSLDVPDKEEVYETFFKVEAEAGCDVVLVDDVKFIPNDYTKVNFMSYGNFEGDKREKWQIIRSGEWHDIALDAHAADLSGGDELISNQALTAGGPTDPKYPLEHIDYPNTLPGQVSFTASGNGTLWLKVELKCPVSNPSNNEPQLTETKFTIDGNRLCTFDVPAEKENYIETILHIIADSANKGTISVDNVKLSLI